MWGVRQKVLIQLQKIWDLSFENIDFLKVKGSNKCNTSHIIHSESLTEAGVLQGVILIFNNI